MLKHRASAGRCDFAYHLFAALGVQVHDHDRRSLARKPQR
jgi:hypothetical protein